MLGGPVAIAVFLAYTSALFGLSLWAERARAFYASEFRRRAIYVLSCCVYCSAWSFNGAVGFASSAGIDFLPLYIGPILVFALAHPAMVRMVRLARAHRITSVADFIAARYGKAASVAATVTIIATLASIPYLSMQTRAIAQSLAMLFDGRLPVPHQISRTSGLAAIGITVLFAALTMILGTRRLDATEQQKGLLVVVAIESIIKLVAFVGIGICVSWSMFGGIGDLTETVERHAAIALVIDKPPDPSMWISLLVMTMSALLFLPRLFHVSVVENRSESHVYAAAWFVPLYLVTMTIFVMPLAVAGLATFAPGEVDRDFTVLALPIHAQHPAMALLAFVGSLAASSSAILITTTSLAIMISNDLVMPFVVGRGLRGAPMDGLVRAPPILTFRRLAIVTVLGSALIFLEVVRAVDLSATALLSLALIVQIAPAGIAGLVWRRGTARGAIGGMVAGSAVVAYTLVLPAFVQSPEITTAGPLGIDALRPTDLFGLDMSPFGQSVFWSLSINVAAFVVLSLLRGATTSERLQANVFVSSTPKSLAGSLRLRRARVGVEELLVGVARFLDPVKTRQLFQDWHVSREIPFDGSAEADAQLIQYAELLIASSIGVASARVVISLLLNKKELSGAAALQIVDDAALEIQNSRDILQHAIDIAHDGMAVYDSDLRLVAWNRAYRDMFQLPANLLRVGTPLDVLVRSNAERGVYGSGSVEDFVATRLEALTRPAEGIRLYSAPSARVLEMRSMRLHNGGMFFTYSDATAQVTSEEEMEAENMTLERRVRERTDELERLNVELIRAKAEAEDANISKSRFLAAASHDLLQPLSAARLYSTSLRERLRSPSQEAASMLATNLDASLEAVEDILGALLEISHLDAGATKSEIADFAIGDLLTQLGTEFGPAVAEKGLRLRIVPSSLRVVSDRRLLRRMLQNLISNAVKYTTTGTVLIGARRRGTMVHVAVHDTGIGIPASKNVVIFREFERLPDAAQASPGVGLGLSIVERLGRVLKHDVAVRSIHGRGSLFLVEVPLSKSAASPSAGAPIGTTIRPRSLEGLTVAAIDNESDILLAIELLLQGWDCFVAKGTSLAEIKAALDRIGRAPDVIVADYHIGSDDGLSVIQALRQLFGPLPAVLVTADRSPVIRDLAFGADVRILYKPVKPAALRALLSQWHLVKAAAE